MGEWWRGAVIYQIYPRSFMDSDGDGVGDLAGITTRLDHVASLGADAIWISPFYRSPQKDFGYDVSDHCAVDPAMGTLEDFDVLVARAHALGLKVILDLILCHTSNEHAWFRESRSSCDGPLADRYVWRDPRPDGSPPNNWVSVFGGPAWTWESRRRQFYLHHFLPEQPAVNLADDASIDAVLEVAEFWLERGVDGFRLDALDHWTHDPMLRDNPPAEIDEVPAKPWGMQDHLFDKSWRGTHVVTKRLRALMDRHPGTTTIGELASDPWPSRIHRFTGGSDDLHMAYSLTAMGDDFDADSIEAMVRGAAEASEGGWPCHGVSNHDTVRLATRWCTDANGKVDRRVERMIMEVMLTVAGSLSMYQGDELGLTQADIPFDRIVDPFGLAYWPEYKGRDGARTPMPWTEDANGGFSTAPRTWLPVPEEHLAMSVSAQEGDNASLLAAWRDMLAFRRRHPALRRGAMLNVVREGAIISWTRKDGDERLHVAVNTGAAMAMHDAPVGDVFHTLQDHPFGLAVLTEEGSDRILLLPYQVAVVRLALDPQSGAAHETPEEQPSSTVSDEACGRRADRMIVAMFGVTGTTSTDPTEPDPDLEVLPHLVESGQVLMVPKTSYLGWTVEFRITELGHQARMRELRRRVQEAEDLAEQADRAFTVDTASNFIEDASSYQLFLDEGRRPAEPVVDFDLDPGVAFPDHDPAKPGVVEAPSPVEEVREDPRALRAMARHMHQLAYAFDDCRGPSEIAEFMARHAVLLAALSPRQRQMLAATEGGRSILEHLDRTAPSGPRATGA